MKNRTDVVSDTSAITCSTKSSNITNIINNGTKNEFAKVLTEMLNTFEGREIESKV